MPETREHPLSKAAESATLMTEWFWPPLAALRAMERWSSSGATTPELPDADARLSERLESVEEQDQAIQNSVKAIETKLDGLAKQSDALNQRVSDMDSALGTQPKELTALKQANAERKRKPKQPASATEEDQRDEPTQAMKILGAGAGRDKGTKASPKERAAEPAKRPSPSRKPSTKTRS